MYNKTSDTLDNVNNGTSYARTAISSVDGNGNVISVVSGSQVNDGAGLANAVARNTIIPVQHGQVITFPAPFQNAPRVAFYNTAPYQPASVWGTAAQITLQSGMSSAPLSALVYADDSSTNESHRRRAGTVQARLKQVGIQVHRHNGGGSIQTGLGTSTNGVVVTGSVFGPQSGLPATTQQYTFSWTGATGWHPQGGGGFSNTTGFVQVFIQYSANGTSGWVTLATMDINNTGTNSTSFTVGNSSINFTSGVPAVNGYFRPLLVGTGAGATSVTGLSLIWYVYSGTTQYASMAPLTGSMGATVNLEAFAQ